MKIKTSGFTLVELMIVIAIIGILAAALFPSMTNYLKRSRDAARQSNMRDIGVALGAFYADQGKYPNANAGCIVYGANGASGQFNSGAYMEKGVPKDPNRTANENGCANGNYGYTTPKINGGASGYLLVSALENVNGGNTASGVAAIISTTNFIPTSLKQGAGSGYILPN